MEKKWWDISNPEGVTPKQAFFVSVIQITLTAIFIVISKLIIHATN